MRYSFPSLTHPPLIVIVGNVRISHFPQFNTENVMILLRMLAYYLLARLLTILFLSFLREFAHQSTNHQLASPAFSTCAHNHSIAAHSGRWFCVLEGTTNPPSPFSPSLPRPQYSVVGGNTNQLDQFLIVNGVLSTEAGSVQGIIRFCPDISVWGNAI